ncbi:biotin--protein ligase-like [Watersipora subatra]|uniref:biotin--protein ligase-like n=1 Tax=Watersipora subatra TaxID=2589382 RepID=UPI00355B2108
MSFLRCGIIWGNIFRTISGSGFKALIKSSHHPPIFFSEMFLLPSLYVSWRHASRLHTAVQSSELSEILKVVLTKNVSVIAALKTLGPTAIPLELKDGVVKETDEAYVTVGKKTVVNLPAFTPILNNTERPQQDMYILLTTSQCYDSSKGHDSEWIPNFCTQIAYLSGATPGMVCRCTLTQYLAFIDQFLTGQRHQVPGLVRIESIAVMERSGLQNPGKEIYAGSVDYSGSSGTSMVCALPKEPTPTAEGGMGKTPDRASRMASVVNILVYVGADESFQPVYSRIHHMLLESRVDTDWHIIYRLSNHDALNTNWAKFCELLVIVDQSVRKGSGEVYERFAEYFNNGGSVLSIGSRFDEMFCTRADLVQGEEAADDTLRRLKVTYGAASASSLVPVDKHCYESDISKKEGVTLSILAKTETSNPIILEATHPEGGKAIFSQAYLNEDVTGCMPITIHILDCLGIRRAANASQPVATVCQVYCPADNVAQDFLSHVSNSSLGRVDNCLLNIDKVSEFSFKKPGKVTSFDWQVYKESLTSNVIGNVLLYQELCASTQLLIQPFNSIYDPKFGLVAIAHRQFSGVGRGSNSWISPAGSLSLSMQVSFLATSNLGQAPALLQTIPAVAVARIIATLLPASLKSQECKVSVKWPNDIYYKKTKIGGIIVSCSTWRNQFIAVVGVGVNVKNLKPTENLNDIVHDYNEQNGSTIPDVSAEWLAGQICNHMEYLIDLLNKDKTEFMNEYYKHWMHSGVRVHVPEQNSEESMIIGLDEHGFLRLQSDDGSVFSVQPDGNSFDILHNLITVKERSTY